MDNNDFFDIIREVDNPIDDVNIDFEIILDDNECSSLRFERIKTITDKDKQFEELKKFIKDNYKFEYTFQLFPEEFYDAIASQMLNIELKPYKYKDFFEIIKFN